MKHVEFTSENEISGERFLSSAPSGITGYLLKKGYVKNMKQATMLLVGVIVVSLIVTVTVILLMRSPNGKDVSPKELKQYIDKMNNFR